MQQSLKGMEQLMQMMGGGDMNEMMTKLMGEMGDMDMGQIMSQGIEMWEQAIDSPEMEAMFNDPNQLRETMEPFIEMFGGACGVRSARADSTTKLAPCHASAMPLPRRPRGREHNTGLWPRRSARVTLQRTLTLPSPFLYSSCRCCRRQVSVRGPAPGSQRAEG